ncbi:MAG: AAA family ATPase [Anaerolineae bacterium]
MKSPPKLYLITGHTGAGKSTIAKRMAKELPAFYLSHDELLVLAYGDNIEKLDFKNCCERLDVLIWKQAKQLFGLNIDIVLEGYGSREMRDGVRTEAAKIGYVVEVIWVECPAEERLRRVHERNKNLNDEGFLITEEDFYRMEALDGDLGEDETFTRIDNSTPI